MIGYAPYLGQVKLQPNLKRGLVIALGQILDDVPLSLSVSEAAFLRDGLDRAMRSFQDNPYGPCVIRFDRRQLESLRARLQDGVSGRETAALTSAEMAIVEEAIRCGEEIRPRVVSPVTPPGEPFPVGLVIAGLLGAASIGVSAYHGYKRNNSTGWAIWWGFMGALFPVLTPAVAIAQGFGKREKK